MFPYLFVVVAEALSVNAFLFSPTTRSTNSPRPGFGGDQSPCQWQFSVEPDPLQIQPGRLLAGPDYHGLALSEMIEDL